MPAFLMALTLIGGVAFADNKGHVCIEEKGFKSCLEGALDASTEAPITQKLYNQNYND